MKLIWSRRALADLQSIREWIRQDNPRSAEKVANQIVKSTGLLKQFPFSGIMSESEGIRELRIPRLPYILPYRIIDDDIELLAVFDMRRLRPEKW